MKQQRESNKLILMFSSLRINAICALIPCEEKKKCAFFFCVCAHVAGVFTKSYACVYVASRISLNCANDFTVSESFVWFTRVVGLQSKQHRY